MKRGLAHCDEDVTIALMSFLRLTLLVFLLPLGLVAPVLGEEKKPSLIYYYFDG
tara:strand:- start:349 stop:510 length:162 start_codon:yes stop_codon:yes gene_type:complete